VATETAQDKRRGNARSSIGDAMRELRCRPRSLWLELARGDQSDRWRRGARTAAEEYFAELPELSADEEEALVMICGEVQLRREVGERPEVDEYQQRFPGLANEIAIQFNVDSILDDENLVEGEEGARGYVPFVPDLPGYEFLERIGSGASSIVYRARQTSLARFVAIKVLVMPSADPKRLARQRQEAEILARLKHPNVVHVYEVLDYGGCIYLVMEYVDGPTLQDYAAGKPLSAQEAAQLVLTLAVTIEAVHEAGVLHRDLKPSNVLVPSDGRIRVTDFGLAKMWTQDNLLTTEDSVLGTPSYMSPEQALGRVQAAGPQTDIYSLGAILYELLTGRPPFLGATVLDTLSLIRDQDPVPPRQLQPSTPADLETVCLHCLNKSPQNRYATASALAGDLRRFLAGEPILARRFSPAQRLVRWCRRNPVVAGLASAVVVLLVSVILMLTAKNAGIRREAAAKDSALLTARQAVDQMLKRVADDKLSNMPLGHPLRAELLQDALQFYEGFLAQGNDDPLLREEMAGVLNSKGCIERELGRCDDACRSFEKSIALLESIVADDPEPPAISEKLAAAQEGLAYTMQLNPNGADGSETDASYRRALQMYRDLERDWPERRQPVGHCLRHLADLAFKRDDRAQAEKYWREAIASGESYLELYPKNIDARSNLCWACADLCDSILIPSGNCYAESKSILNKGLSHVSTMRQLDPNSSQAREVGAFLRVCLAQCTCRTGDAAEATKLFQQGIEEMESLCAESPWNRSYWELVRYFQQQCVRDLTTAKQLDAATQSIESMAAWLKKIGPQLPDDPVPQAELQRSRTMLVALMRSTAQEDGAKAIEAELSTTSRQSDMPQAGTRPD
jgi:eukaryotic-like serine/threonine-protein kinase